MNEINKEIDDDFPDELPINLDHVPEALRELLLEFTIAYLLEQPDDIVEYGIAFFIKMRDTQKPVIERKERNSFDNQFSDDYNFHHKKKEVDDINEFDEPDIIIPKTDAQLARFKKTKQRHICFNNLNAYQTGKITESVIEINVEPNDILFSQGDNSKYCYIIESGTFTLSKNGVLAYSYYDWGVVGLIGLLKSTKRYNTFKAETKGVLWAFDSNCFMRYAQYAFKNRMAYRDIVDKLKEKSVLHEYFILTLADNFVPIDFHKGDTIMKPGEVPTKVFFIQKGKVSITRKSEFLEFEVDVRRNGDGFGYIALDEQQRTWMGAYAIEDGNGVYVDRDIFLRILGSKEKGKDVIETLVEYDLAHTYCDYVLDICDGSLFVRSEDVISQSAYN